MTTEQRNETLQTGIKVCIWPKAYRQAAQAALDRVFDEGALNVAYRACINSNDVKVSRIVKPNLQMVMRPGNIIWTLDNASVSVHHQRRLEHYEENYEKHCSGSFEITIDVIGSGPLHDPIYNTDINLVDLLFSVSSHGSNGVYNGVYTAVNNGVIFIGGTYSNVCFSSSNYQSLPQIGSRKRSASPLNGPESKRSRHNAPISYSGINQSIRSTDNNASIKCSGINQSIASSGRDALLVCSGISSMIVSTGESASITCSGVSGSVNSSGSDAFIKGSGTSTTIHSSGSGALIKASGTSTTIQSSGPDAVIDATGTNTAINSTGSNASISFSGAETRVRSSGSAINDDLGKTLIRALANTVTECLNWSLPDYSLQVDSRPEWMFENGYLCSTQLVVLDESGDPVMIPIQDVPSPEPQDSGRMLTMFVSNCVINTIGYHLHHNNSLSYNLTQADLIAQASQNSSAINASGRTRCLLDCFPEFSVKYPGASVEVNLDTVNAPTASFSGQNLKVTLLGSAIFQARLPDGSVVDFLSTEVDMVTTVLLKLNLGKLKGTVTSVSPTKISVVSSDLESVNREVLRKAFDLIAVEFLSRKFEELAQKGIPLPLPLLSGVEEFENFEMSAAGDFLRIDADLKFYT